MLIVAYEGCVFVYEMDEEWIVGRKPVDCSENSFKGIAGRGEIRNGRVEGWKRMFLKGKK